VVYMGTPDFAVPPLKALAAAGHDVALAVTKPDRAKDRGKKIQSCPVKLAAQELGIRVETPERIRGNEEFLGLLGDIAPDIIVVAAYGKILPKEVLELPRLGCFNIHASLLPAYRGSAPIHRAVIDGCEKTGVTIMCMEEGLDTGDMIARAETEIGEKTTAQLHEELAELGAKLLIETLPRIEDGTAERIPQDEALASYAPMVFKEEGIIDFSRSAAQICCLVRGFNSWPTASTSLLGQVMKVHMARPGKTAPTGKAPGTVLSCSKAGIEVSCGDGSVLLTNIQMPGKKAMDAAAFLLGNKIEIGTVLG
ncbi:MAG: methionyl-tRNA formyltransferase, partial [Firmicutes bacterium]|nr:methionyl-tRNA formyltransferase [Bacillota bacterium]